MVEKLEAQKECYLVAKMVDMLVYNLVRQTVELTVGSSASKKAER